MSPQHAFKFNAKLYAWQSVADHKFLVSNIGRMTIDLTAIMKLSSRLSTKNVWCCGLVQNGNQQTQLSSISCVFPYWMTDVFYFFMFPLLRLMEFTFIPCISWTFLLRLREFTFLSGVRSGLAKYLTKKLYYVPLLFRIPKVCKSLFS